MKINIGKLKRKSSWSWLAFSSACAEIKLALGVGDGVAGMVLQGLVATGNVHACDDAKRLVDLDECTIAEYEGRVAFVDADDLRYWLNTRTATPQPKAREAVIERLLAEGLNPPRNIKWKLFNDRVRDACNGWVDDRPALGFSDKQIQRVVKELRTN